MKIVISSGHGQYIRGASGNPVPPQLDEVDEARRVVDRVAEHLRALGVETAVFHDNTSRDQDTNLKTIVNFHNAQGPHDLDVSVHFNAYDGSAHGTEVLYVTQDELADDVCDAIVEAGGFTDRGAKYRGDLYWLNNTLEPAILIETCFCDNDTDSHLYHGDFEAICRAIAETLSGEEITDRPEQPPEPEEPPELTGENRVEIVGWTVGDVTVVINGQRVSGNSRCINAVNMDIAMHGDVTVTLNGQDFHNEPPSGTVFAGTCSWFGGPQDSGVSPDEGLAFLFSYDDAPDLFLDQQPPGTTGLARRLNPERFYVACRWNYDQTPKEMLADQNVMALVKAKKTGRFSLAHPADWGPHEEETGRAADLSPGLMAALGIETDDEVEVVYPAPD